MSAETSVREQDGPAEGQESRMGRMGRVGSRLNGRSGWILAVCCAAQFMVILDLSIVNVALPSIQSALEFSSPGLQWVVYAYSITFAGFLMLGGRVADHFGPRRMFIAALALFALTSLAGGLAPDRGVLVAARAAQGVVAAMMAAGSLAIITASFERGPKLNRAIATWAAMNGLGGAAGTLLGGVITEVLSWRWVLLINPPIGIAAALVAFAVVAGQQRKGRTSFDIAGALLLTVGQMALVYGVVEAGLVGWSQAKAIVPIVVGLGLLAGFVVVENRVAENPLIPFKKLTAPLRTANNIVILFSAALFPMWIVSSLYLQQVLGLSPFHTGLIFLPMTIVIMLTASRAGLLVSRFGVRPVLGSGLVMMTAGMALFTRIGANGSGIVFVMIPGILTAAGIAMSIVPSTIAATQGAQPGQAGLASGLVNTSRQIGGGLGLAVLVTLATQRSSHLIGTGEQVRNALTGGFQLAYLIGACLTGAAALLTFVAVRKPEGEQLAAGRRLVGAAGIGVAAFVILTLLFAHSTGAPLGAYTTGDDTYSFVTEPGLHPPKLRVRSYVPTKELQPGYIFTTNFLDLNEPPIIGQSGPMILDRRLRPVWFRAVPEDVVAGNLSLESWQGKPALAWWQGRITNTGATETGEYVVVNQHYQTVARIHGQDGWDLTLHSFTIEGEDAWVTAEKNLPMNLAKYGGAYNGALIDAAVQKYDLRTGKLLYSWDALKHIPLEESYATLPTNGFPWDAYHINAIDPASGGQKFLVSMRDTWAAYLVNAPSEKIEWTLGGRNSSFELGPEADFQWQHDVSFGAQPNTITMFDDHCCQLTGGGTYVPPTGPSRGLELKLDQSNHTASLVHQYGKSVHLDPQYMGDTEPLQDGNVFVGWGSEPYLSEYSKSGKLLYEGEFPGPDISYRTEIQPWVGLPLTKPAGAARRLGGHTTVHASWNGATEVRSWRVLAGSGSGPLKPVAKAARNGFETAIPLTGTYESFEVQALGSGGKVLGTSRQFAG